MNPNDLDGISPEEFTKLQELYLSKLPERLEKMHSAIEELRKNLSKENIQALQFLIHKMAGNAGTFGYPEVSQLCKEWDLKLAQAGKQPQPEISFEDLDRFFAALQKTFQLPSS